MSRRDAEVQVSSNVTITVLNKNNEVIQTVKKHNKATTLMVEGLLHFLQGWYSDTEFNKNLSGGSPEDSLIYVPTKIGFGNIGVKTKLYNESTPVFSHVDSGEFVQPSFNSIKLQSPLHKWKDSSGSSSSLVDVEYQQFSSSELVSGEDLNNSESLHLITRIPAGRLVGEIIYVSEEEENKDSSLQFQPYDGTFYDPKSQKYCTMITEIGLFSSENTMLARVLLDGEVESEDITVTGQTGSISSYKFKDPLNLFNPIVQAEDTTLIVEWQIGLIAVGDNDHFVSQNTIYYQDLAKQISNYITENPGASESQIAEKILEILGDYSNIETTNN